MPTLQELREGWEPPAPLTQTARKAVVGKIIDALVSLRWDIARHTSNDIDAEGAKLFALHYEEAQKKLQEAEFWLGDLETRGGREPAP